MNKIESKNEYMKYIAEHKENVGRAFSEVEQKLTGEYWLDEYTFSLIKTQVFNHDLSKYSTFELEAYRNYFFPYEGEKKDKDRFRKAFHRHVIENKHHWNHWVLVDTDGVCAMEMPFVYVFEMLLDWKAMSYKFNDTVKGFYKRNKSNMVLHETTIKTIENWIDIF